jgi:hypothetical protein
MTTETLTAPRAIVDHVGPALTDANAKLDEGRLAHYIGSEGNVVAYIDADGKTSILKDGIRTKNETAAYINGWSDRG